MRSRLTHTLLAILMLTVSVRSGDAQLFCDDPPSLSFLTGESISVSGLSSEGHPVAYSWYITPPGGPIPQTPTSTAATYTFAPRAPVSGAWRW